MGANTEGSSVHYQSEDEIDASKRQIIFTNIMDKGRLVKSATYKKVEVLMLCWAHSSDDMGTRGEVNDLKSVFESTFGYHAVIGQLDSTKPLQTQVNRIVAEFVDENNRPDTLLIVYYAGHGKPGGENSHLELIGLVSMSLMYGEILITSSLQADLAQRP